MTAAPGLTPALLDLMEHEKVIEQGIAGFRDVGHALARIRDGRKYRALDGIDTFEDYCRQRWDLSRRHADRLIEAATIAEEVRPMGLIAPRSERQLRPLKRLPEAERADAWAEAVADADGDQPTAAEVSRVVERRRPPPRKIHPATFSEPILDQIVDHLAETVEPGVVVLDPFAGTGRVHRLVGLAGVERTIGVELEPEWAALHPDTIEGNALELAEMFGAGTVAAIVTSPTYGNRMADHHDAHDESVRLTYKHTLGRELHDDNSGAMQWGPDYRTFHERVWRGAVAVLEPGGTLTLNVKNHVRAGAVQRVAEWHIDTLYGLGLHLVALDVVPTRGLMAGANAGERTAAEYVATFRKPGP